MKKKILFSFLIGIFVFSVSFINVRAKTLNGYIDLNEDEYFNVFREFNQSTPLANFLIAHGYNIIDDLSAELSRKGTTVPQFGNNAVNNVFLNKDLNGNTIFILSNIKKLSFNDYGSDVEFTSNIVYYLKYDENMNIISYGEYTIGYGEDGKNKFFELVGNPLGFWGDANLTNFLSNFYYFLDDFITLESNVYDRIILNYVFQTENYYDFDNWKWYDYLFRFLTWPTNMPLRDFKSNFDLEYYKNNALKGTNIHFKAVGNVLFEQQKAEIPSGFSSFNLESDQDVVFLTYKGDDDCNESLYFYSTFPGTKIYSTAYDLGASGLVKIKDAYFGIDQAFATYYFSPYSVYEIDTLNNRTFMFYKDESKYTQTVYYDPKAWNLTRYLRGNSDAIQLSNNSGTYTITPSKFQKIYNESFSGNQNLENNKQDSNESNADGFDFGASNILNGFKNFISAISGISSSLTVFLDKMPVELKTMIISFFGMGCIAVIIKIIL